MFFNSIIPPKKNICKIKVEGAKSKLIFFSPIHNVMLGGEHQHKLISFNIVYNFYDFYDFI
jgi:hypothetical protein